MDSMLSQRVASGGWLPVAGFWLGGFPGFRRVDFTVFVKNPPGERVIQRKSL